MYYYHFIIHIRHIIMRPTSKRYQIKEEVRRIWGKRKKGCRGRPGKTGGHRLSKRSRKNQKDANPITLYFFYKFFL